MELILMVCLPAMMGGLIQGVTGFGAGIVMMMVLPYLFGVVSSAALANAIGTIICISMAWRYRKFIRFRAIVIPAVVFSGLTTVAINFATQVNQELMMLILGIFLVALALYFLVLAKDKTIAVTPVLGLVFMAVSGIFNGLFGIGGPLMVIYYLSRLEGKEEYLGTIQTFFLVGGLYATIYRVQSGILTITLIPAIIAGMVAILVGMMVANRIVDHLDARMIRKLTYALIGLSGLYNIISIVIG